MKNLAIEHRLARVQELVADEMLAIANRYYKRQADPRTLACLRAEMNAALELALLSENLPKIRRYILIEVDAVGRVSVSATVPAWDHDCEECDFLGRIDVDRAAVDLYSCGQHAFFPGGLRTFIARYGDDGAQYTTAHAASLEQTKYFHPGLYEALRRWRLTFVTGPTAALQPVIDAFNLWVMDMIAGTVPGHDVVAAFAAAPTEVLEGVVGFDGYFPDFCRYEVSKRRGLLIDWKVEIKGRGRAVVQIKPLAALEFITITTTIGEASS